MKSEEFTLEAGAEKLKCTLAAPAKVPPNPSSGLLLNISATVQYALRDPAQNHPTGPFLAAGHHVLSFDLPCHGERVGSHGESLLGMGRAFLAGDDPFAQFVADGKAALDACLERGIGRSGKIVAYGVSRAGYCLLRLAAADQRVRTVAALSPVTDWGIPEEFSQSCPRTHTWPLLLDHWAEALGKTAVYLSVGSQDDVVGTEACVRFAMKLLRQQRRLLPKDTQLSQLHVVDSPGHSPALASRLEATRFLLQSCTV